MPQTSNEISARYYLRHRERILARNSAWRKENREKINSMPSRATLKRREYNRKWKDNEPAKVARCIENSRLKKYYGISIEQYEAMFALHSGLCDACGNPPSGKRAKAKLQIDHCHGSGKIRGLICGNCNTALGMVNDSAERLSALLVYLRNHHA